MIEYIVVFLMWTLMLYWLHRAMHNAPMSIRQFHYHHHKNAVQHNERLGWRWNNLFLYQDDWQSTLDFWNTEVIPTALFCLITGHWWIMVCHYLWAAFLQENLEHNLKVNGFPLTYGRWHMEHHYNQRCNYGLFIGWWDYLFGTYRKVQ